MQLKEIESNLKDLVDNLDQLAAHVELEDVDQDLVETIDAAFNTTVNFLEAASRDASNQEKKSGDSFFAGEKNGDNKHPLAAVVAAADVEEFRMQLQLVNDGIGALIDRLGREASHIEATMDEIMETAEMLIGEFD